MSKYSIVLVLLVAVAFVVTVRAQGQCGGKNQEFTECGTACPPKCNEDNSQKVCTLQCIVGCQCKRGYLLNGKNECVSPSEC